MIFTQIWTAGETHFCEWILYRCVVCFSFWLRVL